MKKMRKPILYNGFEIQAGIKTISRVAYEFSIDIYKLTNNRFLILFIELSQGELQSSGEDVFEIFVGREKYPAIMIDRYSKSLLAKLLSDMTESRGFDAVAGMYDLKETLQSDVIAPLCNPEKYERFKLSIPNGILLFGPPGCGKTFIVRKLAEEIDFNFVEVKHSDIGSPYIHGTVIRIGRIFEMARANAPSIVFIDEIEGMVPKRDNLRAESEHKQEEINEFLMQFNDAGKQNILVVAATNRPNLIDEALLRAGRMDRLIYVPPPDFQAREELFEMFLHGRPVANLDYYRLASMTPNYASVDIEYIATESARKAVMGDLDVITQANIEKVIFETPSSISDDELAQYTQFIGKQRR